ncbi:DUF2905 domain-containing protein [Chloroflexota bacterium]
MELANLGKVLLVIGGIIVLAGLVTLILGKTGFIGKLAGNILIQRGDFTFYFPIATFLILSVILTIFVND